MDRKKTPILTHIIRSSINHRYYGVTVKYFKEEELIPYKRIDYNAKVSLISNGDVFIDKSNIYYNQHQADSISEIVASAFAQSIYPVRTAINDQGVGTLEVLNQIQILERYNLNRDKLRQKYSSEPLEKLLKKFEDRLHQPRSLQEIFKNDWFCNFLFHRKTFNYKEGENINTRFVLSAIPYGGPVVFEGKQQLKEAFTHYHSHIITFDSEEQLAPPYFIPKKSVPDVDYYIRLNIVFDIDIYRNFSMHTRAILTVLGEDVNKLRKEVKRIEYTHFQQNTSSNYIGSMMKNTSLLVEEDEETIREKPRKRFWNIFS